MVSLQNLAVLMAVVALLGMESAQSLDSKAGSHPGNDRQKTQKYGRVSALAMKSRNDSEVLSCQVTPKYECCEIKYAKCQCMLKQTSHSLQQEMMQLEQCSRDKKGLNEEVKECKKQESAMDAKYHKCATDMAHAETTLQNCRKSVDQLERDELMYGVESITCSTLNGKDIEMYLAHVTVQMGGKVTHYAHYAPGTGTGSKTAVFSKVGNEKTLEGKHEYEMMGALSFRAGGAISQTMSMSFHVRDDNLFSDTGYGEAVFGPGNFEKCVGSGSPPQKTTTDSGKAECVMKCSKWVKA